MEQLNRDLMNTDNLESIRQIQFSLFSDNDIVNGSVCEVKTADTYEGNVPKQEGLFDHSMGTINSSIICPTDEKKMELCPGYFGRVDLGLPVFNYHFVPYIEKLLKCVCFRCSNLLIDKTDPLVLKELEGKKGHARFSSVLSLSTKNKKCNYNNGCFAVQPTKYSKLNLSSIKEKDNIIKIVGFFEDPAVLANTNSPQVFTPLVCKRIFERIKDEDVEFLGFSSKFSRPEWMVISSLAIPPPSVRPSVKMGDNQRSEDDLTHSLAQIIKTNNVLKEMIEEGESPKKINIQQGTLQYLVCTYMDNEIPGIPASGQKNSYRPLKAITQRLKGKEGRIRNNIMGKRIDYTARTVISVDPNIDIDEFGIPEKIAKVLTFPETVTEYNKARLQKMIRNGPSKYPGAKTIVKLTTMCNGSPSPCKVNLKYVDVNKEADNLQLGDVVHRHLLDGDVGIVNRQPTLHRMSMMGHKIKILPGNTFRLNVMSIGPYNADFDGDEMNYHQPQSLQTLEELKKIAMVPTQIISPGTSEPCMKVMVDSVIGAYLLTKYENRFTKQEFQNLLTFSPYYSGKLPEPEWIEDGEPYWSGKQLASMILPDISITHLKDIKIIRGEITEGFLNDSSLGKKPSGIIQQIYNVYGTDLMKRFMNDIEKLVTRYMTQESFSISFGDTLITKEQRKEVDRIIDETIQGAYNIIIKAQQGIYAQDLDDSLRAEKLEVDLDGALADVSENVKKYIVSVVNPKNSLKEAIESGSTKGSALHLTQTMALVGKLDVWTKRIPNEFTYRTLPHFAKYDLSPEAKGYAKTGFIQGLNPADSFFCALSGRNGKIDTAINTADSGYISRKFIKATEDLMVNYDMTVRNAANKIIQFAYGEDNMDASKIEKINKIHLIELDNKQMEKSYKFEDVNDRAFWETFMTNDAIDEMMKDPSLPEILHNEYNELMLYRHELRNNFFKNVEMIGDVSTYLPVNPQRLIQSTLVKFDIQKFSMTDLTPQYVIDKFNEMFASVVQYFIEKEQGSVLPRIILKSFLSTKKVLYEYRMNKIMFDYLIETIRMKMLNSFITPGEMVGVIAAQTLGEGTTQMTLNTFHSVGKGAVVITEGLPRLNEIIKLTKKMKNKNMKIYLKDEYAMDKEQAKKVKTRFAYTKLKDILSQSEIIYVGDDSYTDNDEEREYIRSYREFCEIFGLEQIEEECLSPWMIRFTFDKEAMMIRNISVLEIQERIKEKEPDDLECVFSDDSANNVVMRIRFKNDKSGNFLDFMRKIEKNLSEMTIRGIDGIEFAELVEKSGIKYNIDGSYEAIKEWTITTKGSNLMDTLVDNSVDATKTITNDINEFAEVFGIEAARNLLCIEFGQVYQSNGFNPRHIGIISDMMSYRGKLMQIERHGTNKNSDIGPIGKASFEAVMDVLTKAALFAEKDNMKGVSSNIFAGQFCKAGTNCFEIIMDDEKMMKPVVKGKRMETPELKRELTEKDIDIMMNSIYDEKKPELDVMDEDFNFGFGLEEEKQTVLAGTHLNQLIKKDEKSGTMEHIIIENRNFGEEKIEVPTNSDFMNNNKANINDEKIEIPQESEEVILEEKIEIPQEESDEEEEKPKKKVVKKKNNDNKDKKDKEDKEDKPKKKVVRKK